MINLIYNSGKFLTKFRIPTILGLGIIVVGIGAGVFLTSQTQNPLTSANKNTAPSEIITSNVGDQSVTISWETSDPVRGSVKYGISSHDEQRAVDDRDKTVTDGKIQPRKQHYVTIKNLTPQTTYQYKIGSNENLSSETYIFKTAASSVTNNSIPPVIGTITDNGSSISEGIAYLNIPNAIPQSALITSLGSFTIPLAKVYNQDRLDVLNLTPNTQAELKVVSPQGSVTAKFLLNNLQQPLPPLKIGPDVDLTSLPTPAPTQNPQQQLLKQLDFNGDGFINAADEAILKKNFGNNPQNKNANLNNDNVVDQKDLDILRENLNKSFNP